MRIVTLIFVLVCVNVNADNQILPIDSGLTLAHVIIEGKPQTLAILDDHQNKVLALNLSEIVDINKAPIPLYAELGYSKMVELIKNNRGTHAAWFDYSQLLSPAGTGNHHFATGLNYAAHVNEVDQKGLPFLFLKTAMPTRDEDISVNATQLLDYEVEICARPLHAIADTQVSQHNFAYFLCGDFTDRAQLLRNVDPDNLQSGIGFTDAKSQPGYFPTGPYLVIPHQQFAMLDDINLSLWQNNKVKQSSNTSYMIWGIHDIVADLFTAQETKRDTHNDTIQEWLPYNHISRASSLLLGTPDGVIMRPPSLWFKIKMGTWYVLSAAFLSSELSVKEFVIDRYITQLIVSREFLQPGDTILLKAKWLGQIKVGIK